MPHIGIPASLHREPEVGLLDHLRAVLAFMERLHTIFKIGCSILHDHQESTVCSFLLPLHRFIFHLFNNSSI